MAICTVRAVGTVVVGFGFVSVHPAITVRISVGWGGGPMCGASSGGRSCSGSGQCVWEAKSRECGISISKGLRKTFVGGDKFIDSVVFVDGGVGEVVERLDHSGCLFVGGSAG